MNKKKEENAKQVAGAPEIAHPSNQEAYEKQLAFIYAWFFETLDKCEGDHEKAAREARAELQRLFLNHLSQLLRLALRKDDSKTKQWAGKMLASIGVSVSKHDEKLSKTNAAYVQEKGKIGKLRTDVLFPKPIGEAVKREIKKAERNRKRLLLLKAVCGKRWKKAARRQRIPEAYLPTVELPEFSMKSEPQWWQFLWPLIKNNNRGLLGKLREGKIATRGIRYQSRWATYRKEFRRVLRTLAQLRSGGVL